MLYNTLLQVSTTQKECFKSINTAAMKTNEQGVLPACFEANEVRRMKKYGKESKLVDNTHNAALSHLSHQSPKSLIGNWEDSKELRCVRQGTGIETAPEKVQAEVRTRDIPYQSFLEGKRTKQSLSPVFPIATPIMEQGTGTDSWDVDGWNLRTAGGYSCSGVGSLLMLRSDHPESHIGISPLEFDPVLPGVENIKRAWSTSKHFCRSDQRQTLCQRHLPLHVQVQKTDADGKAIENMSVFINLEAISDC